MPNADHSPQKKKPRQRNRPRNKANRLKELVDDVKDQQDPDLTSVNADDQGNSKAPVCPLISNSERGGQLVATLENQVATQDTYDNNETLKTLQQIMRAKFMKENQDIRIGEQKDVNDGNEAKMGKKNPLELGRNIKKSKSKEKVPENLTEKNAFIANLQKRMEDAMAGDAHGLPTAMLENLEKLLKQDPISDVESSDEEEEYIEYVYKPRQYFMVSLCNFCKNDLCQREYIECSRCQLTYYCSVDHMKTDVAHRQLCYALRQVADNCGGHILYKCAEFTTDQFRSYRIVTIRNVETLMNRPLTAAEQEIILFPRICSNIKCREYKFSKLMDCDKCGQVAYCKDKPDHLNANHKLWCKPYKLFKDLILFQEKFGRLDPSLPSKILKDLPGASCNTKQILSKLAFDIRDPCEYAVLTQISTCPLTAWYTLKLCGYLKKSEIMTIHLIGAEIEFEVDILHKWELFFLHITPMLKQLNVIFVGPELNQGSISFAQLRKTKPCRSCRKHERSVKYDFVNSLYHNYCTLKTFIQPDLVCFFNAGLYRYNGYQMDDTWPDTIQAVANFKCPIVVTSYTEYEAPLDMARLKQESNRILNIILPPTVNPFASEKPERNFISDEHAPLMFKNYYCFVVE